MEVTYPSYKDTKFSEICQILQVVYIEFLFLDSPSHTADKERGIFCVDQSM